MTQATAPDRTEASEYYFKYIDLVATGDIAVGHVAHHVTLVRERDLPLP